MTLAPCPPPPAPAPRRLVAAALNADWLRLSRDPQVHRRVGTWPVAHHALRADGGTDLDALLDATSRDGGLPEAEADAVLAALVRLAADDDVAARVVLQRVVGSLVLVAVRRTRSHPGDRQALFDDLTATAWLVIRSYPIDGRPVRVAANLVRDTEYQTCTRTGRLRSAREILVPVRADLFDNRAGDVAGRPLAAECHPADQVTRLFAAGRAAGVDQDDLDLLDALVVAGRPVGEVARSLRVTPRTVYNRRVAVVERLARLAV